MNEHLDARSTDLLIEAREQMRLAASLVAERAELMATATARGKRVEVTVNADNIIIETRFGPRAEDLSLPELAAAITEAGQQAAAEMSRKTRELLAPLQIRSERLPNLTDLAAEIPDLPLPQPIPASTAPPNSPERTKVTSPDPAPHFSDTESYTIQCDRRGSTTDSAW
ncbi:YbaB/EbfC DNA-binding family protein [Nocardia tenerifensis]|uniref:YbaB/EbfC DNA-binding family protein n=1 Tax=Nocardia tenerifensis TaxID=228006 RepID=A0A318JSR8_9NOCA|nr:YbaB/EbfC family nucleoid-associated protein [Nocardia tenerifensis]PXX55605.1 YbaB/EbfC DNA-binding family protein [Nocardia tenerifensis]